MSKLPSFQFYPGDWLTDPSLRFVSAEARGLWIDILCLMFNGERRGYLQVNGLAPSVEQIARMCNATPEEVQRGFNELSNAAVFSKSADNVIFSRRMVKDEKIRRKRKVIGQLGGNPNFSPGKRNPYYEAKDNQKDNIRDNQKITPSSSSSSSSSLEKNIYAKKEDSVIEKYPKTPDEVLAVAERIGFLMTREQAELFLANYSATGWVASNGQPIRNWKALVSKWKANQYNFKPQKGGSQRGSYKHVSTNPGDFDESRDGSGF